MKILMPSMNRLSYVESMAHDIILTFGYNMDLLVALFGLAKHFSKFEI